MTIEELHKKADAIADNIGMPLDVGIKPTVIGLWAHGIETTGSCEGHLDEGEPFPWVDIEIPQPNATKNFADWKKANQRQAKQVKELLDKFNQYQDFPYPLKLIPRGTYGAVRLQTSRTRSIVDTLPPKYLNELQDQMSTFADFLLNT